MTGIAYIGRTGRDGKRAVHTHACKTVKLHSATLLEISLVQAWERITREGTDVFKHCAHCVKIQNDSQHVEPTPTHGHPACGDGYGDDHQPVTYSMSHDITELRSKRNLVIPLDERHTGAYDPHMILSYGGRSWITMPSAYSKAAAVDMRAHYLTDNSVRRLAQALVEYVKFLDEKGL